MNNLDILKNNIKYNEEYENIKSQYESLDAEICAFVQEKLWSEVLIDYYKQLSVYYESYSELVLNNYHYDFIRNGHAMKNLNTLKECLCEVEELMFYLLDVDTLGECYY